MIVHASGGSAQNIPWLLQKMDNKTKCLHDTYNQRRPRNAVKQPQADPPWNSLWLLPQENAEAELPHQTKRRIDSQEVEKDLDDKLNKNVQQKSHRSRHSFALTTSRRRSAACIRSAGTQPISSYFRLYARQPRSFSTLPAPVRGIRWRNRQSRPLFVLPWYGKGYPPV